MKGAHTPPIYFFSVLVSAEIHVYGGSVPPRRCNIALLNIADNEIELVCHHSRSHMMVVLNFIASCNEI